jgi:hypothetical protein
LQNRSFDLENQDIKLKLAFQPHLVDVSKAPKELQMDLIELSEDNIVKSLFDAKKDPVEIWKKCNRKPTPSATPHKKCFLAIQPFIVANLYFPT